MTRGKNPMKDDDIAKMLTQLTEAWIDFLTLCSKNDTISLDGYSLSATMRRESLELLNRMLSLMAPSDSSTCSTQRRAGKSFRTSNRSKSAASTSLTTSLVASWGDHVRRLEKLYQRITPPASPATSKDSTLLTPTRRTVGGSRRSSRVASTNTRKN